MLKHGLSYDTGERHFLALKAIKIHYILQDLPNVYKIKV